MVTTHYWRSVDLEQLPDDGSRYEIIDGVLYVSKQPTVEHQFAGQQIGAALQAWSAQHQNGAAIPAPGVIFASDNDVAPDVVWASSQRLAAILGGDGHLHGAPELVVEVLSPGRKNEDRDRRNKLNLYARQGVDEYWIVDWISRTITAYRRDGHELRLAATYGTGDMLTTPLLPGLAAEVGSLFWSVPR